MSTELTKRQEGVLAMGTEAALKPLSQEIHLFDTFIAGIGYLKDKTPFFEAKEGDFLVLRREESKFDDNAIVILDKAGRKLGYVPERDNIIFARLMDAGKCLSAKLESKDGQVKIGIYLVDY